MIIPVWAQIAQICQVETGVVDRAIIGWNFYSQLSDRYDRVSKSGPKNIDRNIAGCETNMKHMMF